GKKVTITAIQMTRRVPAPTNSVDTALSNGPKLSCRFAGVVSIQVYIEQEGLQGQGLGSGFILDEEGHIITNNHVVAHARQVTVVFYNEVEAEAKVVGTDADSDLAIIQVDTLPEGTHPLPLNDSALVKV